MVVHEDEAPQRPLAVSPNPINEVIQTTGLIILFTSLAYDLMWLVRQEMQLARTELTAKVLRATRSVNTLATGVFFAYVGVITLLLAASFGLAQIVSLWLAALLIGLLVIIVGILLLQSGRRQLQRLSLLPENNLASLHMDTAAVTSYHLDAAQTEATQQKNSSKLA